MRVTMAWTRAAREAAHHPRGQRAQQERAHHVDRQRRPRQEKAAHGRGLRHLVQARARRRGHRGPHDLGDPDDRTQVVLREDPLDGDHRRAQAGDPVLNGLRDGQQPQLGALGRRRTNHADLHEPHLTARVDIDASQTAAGQSGIDTQDPLLGDDGASRARPGAGEVQGLSPRRRRTR